MPEFTPDISNNEFNDALSFVMHTNESLFLTGKAGTGKTTFLHHIKTTAGKKAIVLAPTGVAANNAGGQTIHSFFHIEPGLYVPGDKQLRTKAAPGDPDKSTIYDNFKYNKNKLNLIRSLELLIIDEISMVRCDLLDVADRLLRVFRRDNRPFGGVQMLLIGDPYQLPPVVENDTRRILDRHYQGHFFFHSHAYSQLQPVHIELKKIYRQTDPGFIELLNSIRSGTPAAEQLQTLNRRCNPNIRSAEKDDFITLTTRKQNARLTNETRLAALNGPQFTFAAQKTGDFKNKNYPAEYNLNLKTGARVMFLKNDTSGRYFNGKIGIVHELTARTIKVMLPDGLLIEVEKHTWENIRYSWNPKEKCVKEEVLGSFTQYPLRLAWAITIHKSQGLTFDNIILDLSGTFAAGQVYVALSRCRSLEGIILKTPIPREAIFTNSEVIHFIQSRTSNTQLKQSLHHGMADFHYKKARNLFIRGHFEAGFENLICAMKLRNDMHTDIFERWLGVITDRYIMPIMNGADRNQVIRRINEILTEKIAGSSAEKQHTRNKLTQ